MNAVGTTLRRREAREENRWRAVLARDGRYDGAFVFAVRSTGIYCRPSCSARRARRNQVVFFPDPASAERAGFRACRRCHPQAADRKEPAPWVERVCRLLEESDDGPLTLARLSAAVGVSPHHLQRTFKRVMGVTPRQYADARRVEGLKARLRQGQDVTRALYEAGYGSSSRLYEQAPAKLGMTPATYRQGGRGMEIHFTTVGSPLGRLLVARTKRGLCSVSLADSDRHLETRLRREYPRADVRRDRNGLSHWVRALVSHLEGRQPRLDLPLDIRGSAFQCRVWEALRRIPYGTTRTYGEVARAIGRPKAARAVGHACATNPVPLVIPCHRVVRGGGGLGGYGLGIERKRALLEMEKTRTTTGAARLRRGFPRLRSGQVGG